MGMTVAEARLSGFREVFRERDLSFSALAFAKACADLAFAVLDDPQGTAALSGAAQFEFGLGRTGRIILSSPVVLALSYNLSLRSAKVSDGRARLPGANPRRSYCHREIQEPRLRQAGAKSRHQFAPDPECKASVARLDTPNK